METKGGPTGQTQSESETQEQNLTVTLESSGDPTLERRIFATSQSVGRQLGYLSAVVEVLLAAHADDPKITANPAAAKAIASFTRSQAQIERLKQLREPEMILEELRRDNGERPAHARELRDKLRAWLARFDGPQHGA